MLQARARKHAATADKAQMATITRVVSSRLFTTYLRDGIAFVDEPETYRAKTMQIVGVELIYVSHDVTAVRAHGFDGEGNLRRCSMWVVPLGVPDSIESTHH